MFKLFSNKMIIFLIDNNIIGVYENKEKFKKDSFFYILDYLVEYSGFESRINASKRITNTNKDDLKKFYKYDNYSDYEFNIENVVFKRVYLDGLNKLKDLKIINKSEEDEENEEIAQNEEDEEDEEITQNKENKEITQNKENKEITQNKENEENKEITQNKEDEEIKENEENKENKENKENEEDEEITQNKSCRFIKLSISNLFEPIKLLKV